MAHHGQEVALGAGRVFRGDLGTMKLVLDLLVRRLTGRDDDRGRSGGATLICRRLQFIAGQCHEGDGRALLCQSKRRGTADS